MGTFVLVHGAWGGSHVWHLVSPLLRAAGHEVFTPTLTGLGERVHLMSPAVNLTTHITDVCNTLYFEDLSEVVLVGHSYGGKVISGAMEHAAERVKHLVFVDAFLPTGGEPLTDRVVTTEDWLVPPAPPRDLPDRKEQVWITERRRPHPRSCFSDLVHLSRPLEEHDCGLTYIKATADQSENAQQRRSTFWQAADLVRTNPRWRYREIATSHWVQSEQPAELVQLLSEAV